MIGSACDNDEQCPKGAYCELSSDGMCGPVTGVCDIYPASCGEGTYRTVCGCDGKSHAVAPCPSPNPVQVDKRPDACAQLEMGGFMLCGDKTCDITVAYCSEGPTGTECKPHPLDCFEVTYTCDCLMKAGVAGCSCEIDNHSGGLRVTECSI